MNKYIFLLGIFITGLFIRIIFLNQHDIWFDEAFSFFVAKSSLHDILIATAGDNHPPFYEILLHFWMQLFGSSEIGLRSFSLLTGILSLPFFYLLAKILTDKKITLFSMSIFALSPLMIYYSVESRMYSLFVLLTLLTTLFYLLTLQKPSPVTRLFFLLFFTLSLYTHYYALLLYIPFLFLVLKQSPRIRWSLFILLGLSLLLFAPWLQFFFSQSHPGFINTNSFISLPATFVSFIIGGTGIVTLHAFFSSAPPAATKFFLGICTLIIIAIGTKGALSVLRHKHYAVIGTFISLPLIFLTFINLFIPIFSIRSTIFLAPFFYMLVALGLKSFSKNIRTVCSIIIYFLLLSVNLFYLFNPVFQGPPIKNSIHAASNLPALHTSILTLYPFRYYQKDQKINTLLTKNPLTTQTISVIGGNTEPLSPSLNQFEMVEITGGADEKELKIIKQTLDRNYKILSKKQFGAITLSIYKKR